MKKLILAIAIAFTGFSVGNSQNMESIEFGMKGGYNYSSLSIADKPNTLKSDGLHGFNLGLFVEVPIIKGKLYVQPEVVYSTQGTSDTDESSVETLSIKVEQDIKLNYLNVPIMFKYYLIDGLSIDLGPQIGFLSSSKIKAKLTVHTANQTYENKNNKDNFKSIDYGLGIGATYKIKAVEGLAISARYNHGLSKIIKDGGMSIKIDGVDYYRYPSNTKNRFIQVGLSYQL